MTPRSARTARPNRRDETKDLPLAPCTQNVLTSACKSQRPVASVVSRPARPQRGLSFHPGTCSDTGAMSFVRLYARVLTLLGEESRLGWMLALRQRGARRGAVRRAGAVRPHRRCAGRLAGQGRGPGLDRPDDPARRLGGVRAVHHRLRRADRAARRPAGASPPPGGDDRLFRAHPAAAAELPRRGAFRPADEGHADRHRFAVVAVARLLPRAHGGLRVAAGAAAAVAVPELAAGAAADRAVRRCSPASPRW